MIFNSQMEITTFCFLVVETIVFIFQSALCFDRSQDKSRKRLLKLTLLFIFYNLCSGLFPDDNIPINLLIQNIFAFGSGIILASYYFYYLVKELNIKQSKLFNVRTLFLSLSLSFFVLYIVSFIITGNPQVSKYNFIILPVIIALFFCFRTVQFLSEKHRKHSQVNTPYKTVVYSGYIGIIFMASMPIVVMFGDYQILNNTLVNVSFILTVYAYFKHYQYQSKLENELIDSLRMKNDDIMLVNSDNLSQVSSLSDFNLTKRELEVAFMILQGLTYNQIAEEMFIDKKTVSKHASNIFKKTNVSSKKEFINCFCN